MNWADLYSESATGPVVATMATGPTGPNQSIVTGGGQAMQTTGGSGPSMAWLGLVLALVALRVVMMMGGKVA